MQHDATVRECSNAARCDALCCVAAATAPENLQYNSVMSGELKHHAVHEVSSKTIGGIMPIQTKPYAHIPPLQSTLPPTPQLNMFACNYTPCNSHQTIQVVYKPVYSLLACLIRRLLHGEV